MHLNVLKDEFDDEDLVDYGLLEWLGSFIG